MTFQDYAARGRNSVWRYGAAAVLAVVLSMVFGAALSLPLDRLGWLPKDLEDQLLHVRDPATFFLLIGGLFGLILAGVVAAVRLVLKKRFCDVIGAWSWRAFGLGAAVWAAALIVLTLVDFALAPSGFSFSATAKTPALAAAALVGLGVQTFAEEFVFRGVLTQGLLLALKRPAPAALLSGLLFGAIHLPNGGPQAAYATVVGVVLAFMAIRTGGLACGYGVHLTNNVFGAVIVVSSGDVFVNSPGLVTQSTPHLMWWDAVAPGVTLVLMGAFVAWRTSGGRGRLTA